MRISRLIAFGLLLIARSVAAPLVTGERISTPDGKEAMKAFREAVFLDVPETEVGTVWRVRSGAVEASRDDGATWVSAPAGVLPRTLTGDWEGVRIGGASAVAKEPFVVKYSLGAEFDFTALAIVDQTVVEFGRRLKEVRPGYFVPEITVLKRRLDAAEGERISTFRIGDENLQYRLGVAWPLSDSLIALVAGTEHPYSNSLVFFDLTVNQPVGFLPYAELNYSPAKKEFRVVEPLTRAQDTPEALEKARREARTIPVWIEGKLNPDLAESDLFAFVSTTSEPPKPIGTPTPAPKGSPTPAASPVPPEAAPDSLRRVSVLVLVCVLVLLAVGWTRFSSRRRS